jgi:hypothetical protein
VKRLLAALVSSGWRRGVVRGSSGWLALGGAAWLLQRVRRDEADVVYREELEPGTRVTISHRRESMSALAGRRFPRRRPPMPFA